MNTPLVSPTAALAHRTSRDHLTAYELVLGFAVATALAVVAALALLMPSTVAPAVDQAAGTPTVSNGQVARGKATLPQSASSEQVAPYSLG